MVLASETEKVLFNTQNQLRKNPRSFLPFIQNQIKMIEGKTLIRPGKKSLMTYEGISAWTETKNALQKQNKLKPLKWQDGLALAAQDHCNDMGKRGKLGHKGTDGSMVWHRIARYGRVWGNVGENLSFGDSVG